MTAKKTLEYIIDDQLPKVLIIGGGIITDSLSKYHQENDCSVTIEESYYPSLGKYNYIYHFGNPKDIETGLKKHLRDGGKFLFIDIDGSEDIQYPDIKILKIGDISLWNKDELVPLVLKVMFSGGKKIIDKRRKLSANVADTRRIDKQTIPYKPIVITKEIKKEIPKPKLSPVIIEKKHIIGKHKLITSSAIIFILLFIFFTSVFYFFYSLKNSLTKFRSDFAASRWSYLRDDIKDLKDKIYVANYFYDVTSNIIFPLKWISSWENIGDTLSVSQNILKNGYDILSFVDDLQNRHLNFLGNGEGISKDDITILKTKINNMQLVLSSSRDKLKDNSAIAFMQTVSAKLQVVDEILPVFEKLILSPAPKVYLLLFQNNMELRPTGGFIGSFGVMTVNEGKMKDMKIYDVYTADGQLKGHVDPPEAIRKYLNQPHFFLRDSNFDPDFAISSVQAEWFLQKELGIGVDGVIGVNLFTIQKILQLTGPLKLADFADEVISAENFFFKAHYFSQSKFFPGSTQKKDFLTSTANALLAKMGDANKSIILEMVPSVKQLLDEKNIIIYSNDDSIQKIVEQKGWAGRMNDVKCLYGSGNLNMDTASISTLCLPDYISIIEANLGVNKANYFINKSVVVEKNISKEGIISSTVTLTYENTGTPEVFSDSIYSNYIRVITPLGSILKDVSINGMPITSTDILSENYGMDKTSFGILVKIAPQNKGIVKINYDLPKRLTGDISSYQLFFQRQGGDKKSPLVMSLKYPPDFAFKPINFRSSSKVDNEIMYTTDTASDRIFVLGK